MNDLIPQAVSHFKTDGKAVSVERYGCGHINITWLVCCDSGKRYILQRIADIFDADILMRNVELVLNHAASVSDDERSYMHLVTADSGKSMYSDESGHYRMYEFIEKSLCLQKPETAEDFYQSAVAFGSFQQLMASFPAQELRETLPNFHNTPDRYRIFREKLSADVCARAEECSEEIAFALAHEEKGAVLQKMRESGELPLRVTHNDTKLNNVMLDADTRKALCVIDLDTVMPGLSLYDFGDSIRFGASTAAEDETALEKVTVDTELFRIFTRGFIKSCPDLTEKEIEMLPLGALTMTLECGVRFLSDYLDGDRYFAVHREKHNLIRARTQFRLVAEMERKWDELTAIVREEAALAI